MLEPGSPAMTALTLDRPDAAPPTPSGFRESLIEGLSRPRKAIPCKFFYDDNGSRLFDRICGLPEYYPTRTEIAILKQWAPAIARWLPRRAVVIEPGGASCGKAGILLDALAEPAAYVPVDISTDHLRGAARTLACGYPRLVVVPVAADFTQDFALPERVPAGPRLCFFPGSTIGNFDPAAAVLWLKRMLAVVRCQWFLIGVDLKKPLDVLLAAYNDEAGVTAAFNLNVLARANRELGADFDLSGFRHEAVYNDALGRIEMHLISRRPQVVTLAGQRFVFAGNEGIHTENSYKYSRGEFRDLARTAGLKPAGVWTDEAELFSVHLFAAA